MAKPFRRMMWVFLFFTILMVAADIYIDQITGHTWLESLMHIVFGASILVAAHIIMRRAMVSQRQAEIIRLDVQAKLEVEVQKRTEELNFANESLRNEISDRVQSEIDRDRLISQIEVARQRAENLVAELHLANNMLVTLIDTLPAGMVIIDTEGRIILANSHARSLMKSALAGDLYDLRDDLVLRRTDGTQIQPIDLPLVRAIQHGEITAGLEVECCLDDGECVHLLMAASPVRDETGQIVNAVEIMQDITHLNEMERALRSSEEKYRTQFDAFSEPTTVWDREGVLLMQNIVSARNLNGEREDFIGKSILELFGEAGGEYLARIQRVIDTGETEYEEDIVDLPKGRCYFSTCIQRIQNRDGQSAAQILSYDITERRRIEDSVRDSEEKFSTVFHFSPNPVGIVRVVDGVFLEINQALAGLVGRPRSEMIGRVWNEVGFDPSPADHEAIVQTYRSRGTVRDYELQLERPGQCPLVLLISLIPITIREEACVLAIAHDITERKQAEEALRQTQSELARGIQERSALQERQRLSRELHDSVSQALYGISLGAHTALTLFESDREKVLEAINYVLTLAQAGLTEMRALIFELRPESLKQEGLVSAIGKQTAALRARHGIDVNYHACEEPDIAIETKEALYRIALEAMQNALKHAQPHRLDIVLCSDPDQLSLDICDDGIGFDPQQVYPGHLGLQSMRERTASIGGSLEILSEPNKGTQIHLRVPLLETAR